MWGTRDRRREDVTCIACDRTVSRSAAREYDKEGDRWERADKEFEHLCKRCHRELCHQPRSELEALLIDLGAGEGTSREQFLRRYNETVEERYGSAVQDEQ